MTRAPTSSLLRLHEGVDGRSRETGPTPADSRPRTDAPVHRADGRERVAAVDDAHARGVRLRQGRVALHRAEGRDVPARDVGRELHGAPLGRRRRELEARVLDEGAEGCRGGG